MQYDIGRDGAIRAEWDRLRFKFADRRDDVNLYTVGVAYRFN